jgi:hypothetical protein
MAITKEIIIKANTEDAVTSVDSLSTSVEGLGDAAIDTSKDISGIKKASQTASKGIKGIGVAFKALGIGIIVALFAKLAEILSRNQKVMDLLSNVMKTLEIAFKDLFSFVTDNFMPAFERVKTFFQNLTFKQVGEAIKKNIIERFNSVLDVIGFIGKAFKKLREGDLQGALEEIKNAGKEMVDVFTGVDGTVDKVTETITKGAKAISNYAKQSFNAAKAITDLGNQALIAAAINQGIIEQYDRQAEQLRQIRDDDAKNIEVRIEANRKLGEVLEEQQEIMLRNADLVIAAAQNEFDLNGNIENQIALIEARNEKLAIQAQIEGFRSEQLVNINGLLREQGEIEQAALDAIIEQEKIKEDLRKKAIEDLRKLADEEIAIQKEISASKMEGLDILIDLAGRESALGIASLLGKQALAVQELLIDLGAIKSKATRTLAEASLDGAKATSSVATGFAATLSLGFPAAIPALVGYAGAAVGIVTGVLSAVKGSKSVAARFGAIGGGGSQASIPTATAPSFNLVEGTGSNQIAEGLARQDNPIRAFVVSSDQTTAAAIDRNIVKNSRL